MAVEKYSDISYEEKYSKNISMHLLVLNKINAFQN